MYLCYKFSLTSHFQFLYIRNIKIFSQYNINQYIPIRFMLKCIATLLNLIYGKAIVVMIILSILPPYYTPLYCQYSKFKK